LVDGPTFCQTSKTILLLPCSQDAGDIFRQFAADQQGGGGLNDPNSNPSTNNNANNNNNNANSNNNNANNRNSNTANNVTLTVSGTTRRTTAR
jgi:hypothetical protein